MNNKLKNVKLGLLGIAAAAIPIFFILQADKINLQKDDVKRQKTIADSLTAINFKQEELIDFYKTELTIRPPSDTGRSTIQFIPMLSFPKSDFTSIINSIDRLGECQQIEQRYKDEIDDLYDRLSLLRNSLNRIVDNTSDSTDVNKRFLRQIDSINNALKQILNELSLQ